MKHGLAVGMIQVLVLFSLLVSAADNPAPPPAAAPAAAIAPPITMIAVGDVNMGSAHPSDEALPPDGGAGLFTPVAHYLKGDIVFGNLEGPLADSGTSIKCGPRSRMCFAFRTPTKYVRNLKDAGFTVMGVANNHAFDFGEEGRKSTLAALDGAQIAHSGPPGDVAELNAGGKKVALLAFSTGELSYNLLKIDEAVEAVKKVASSHDLVVVTFHGGSEGLKAAHVVDGPEDLSGEPRGHLIAFAHAVIDAGAALVIGHGPHLLRGMEVYRGRLIAYSLGNFCTYGSFNLSGPLGRTVILSVDLDPQSGAFMGGRMQAVLQEGRGGPMPDPSGEGIAILQRLSREDFRFTAPVFEEGGLLKPPASDTAGFFTLGKAEERKRLRNLLEELAAQGISEERLRWAFGDNRAGLLPEIHEHFAKPAEALPYEKYRLIFFNDEVLGAGKKFLEDNRELLDSIEGKFGVDRQALAAVLATETRFGAKRGEFRTLSAFATMALGEGSRASWARKQLLSLFQVFAEDPLAVTGSYAGAIGLVQFLPSSIQHYGLDFDGDGRIDLDALPDALASAANYLKGEGWKKGGSLTRGSANYRAIYAYNPAHSYVRVVTELAEAFGYPKPAASKVKGSQQHKPLGSPEAPPAPVKAVDAGGAAHAGQSQP